MGYLKAALGSPRDPILFDQMRSFLCEDLLELFADINSTMRTETLAILNQIGTDLEMLRGTEARLLAKNGDFLDRLGAVMGVVLKDMVYIEASVKPVKEKAEEAGYI